MLGLKKPFFSGYYQQFVSHYTSINDCVFSSFAVQEWHISRLCYEYDSEPFGKERDVAIQKLASEVGVEVIVRISHTLYDLEKVS